MSYQSISPRRHRHLARDYLTNRSEKANPINSYALDVKGWAQTSVSRMQDHCSRLLETAINPPMLGEAIKDIGRGKIIGDDLQSNNPKGLPWDWLRSLNKRVLSNEYRVGKYKKCQIPKPGKSGFRTIEVPGREARVLARSLCNALTPILDPHFYPLSIGFRPQRSPVHGLAAAKLLCSQNKLHVVTCDIQNAFGMIPKKRMLEILSSRLHQSNAMGLIEELLIPSRKKGVPQGISISPLCMNVYLDHLFDHWFTKTFPGAVLVRYADDIAVFCDSRESAKHCFSAIQKRILSLGMKIKESVDEAVSDLSSGDDVSWLGFRLRWREGGLQISLNELTWKRLQFHFQEMLAQEGGQEISRDDLKSTGFQWMTQKALGVQLEQIPQIAEQVRMTASLLHLDMSLFTDDQATIAWRTGQRKAQEAELEVAQWFKDRGANSLEPDNQIAQKLS